MSNERALQNLEKEPLLSVGGFARRIPFWLRIGVALALGVAAGEFFGKRADLLKPVSDIVLQLLRMIATPLIFVAVVNALSKSSISGKIAAKLFGNLIANTVVAILIGLALVNVAQPGRWVRLVPATAAAHAPSFNIGTELLGKIPANFVDPFGTNDLISIIIVAVAVGIALRIVRARQTEQGIGAFQAVQNILDTAYDCVLVILGWILQVVPLAVFAAVARTVGSSGVRPLLSMGVFVISVIAALAIQVIYYMIRIRFGSWVRPRDFLLGTRDALAMAFSTASSAATIPVSYEAAASKIGVREESASLGVLVGGTFNHDGAALYEAMAALFISQAMGLHFSIVQQGLVALMAILASVGAAGIPSAGLVTMLAVFTAVHLPLEYVPLLLPLDWVLDRCRTAVNVMGDLAVTCILDGKTRPPGQTTGDIPDYDGPREDGNVSESLHEPLMRA